MRRPSWLTATTPPTVAIEIAARRVTVVGLGASGAGAVVSGQASEILQPGVVTPALTGVNVHDANAVTQSLQRALERAGLGMPRRAALVVPDSIARVSLVPFEQLPSRPAELEQLIRWQMKKATPYPIEEAQISSFVASTDGSATTMAAVVARRDVVTQFENVLTGLGIHAGLVDLASLNVMNAVIGAGAAPAGDWLLVHRAADATTLAILRGHQLMFYRHRLSDEESLGALVHQTAMYHEDRLGGAAFARVWLSGAGADTGSRDEIAARLGVPAAVVDVRGAANIPDRPGQIDVSVDLLDALAAPVGILLREQRAA